MLRDSIEYLNSANNWNLHKSFYCFNWEAPTDFRGFTKRPPLYPLFLWATGATSDHKWLSLLIQNLLSLLNIALAIRLFHFKVGSFKPSKFRFVVFLLACLFSVSQVIYANLIMAEILLQTVVMLLLHQVILVIKSNRSKNWVWSSLLVIAGFLTKPVFLFFAFLLPMFWVFIQFRKRSLNYSGLIGLIWVLTPLFVIHFYSIQNRWVTGLYHFSSISVINLLHYNTRYMLLNKYGTEKADSILDPLMIIPGTRQAFVFNNSQIRERCINYINENKFFYFKIHLGGMIRMMVDPGRFDVYQFFTLDKMETPGLMEKSITNIESIGSYLKSQSLMLLLLLLSILIFNILKLFCFGCFLLSKNISLLFRLLLFNTIFYFVFLTGPLGASRFLVPVLPLLLCSILFILRKGAKDEKNFMA
jgi:hypothetical protein